MTLHAAAISAPHPATTSAPSRRAARFGAAALGACLVLGSGCSADKHTFLSTATAPKSVDVRYVQSGETAWSMDIPSGHELTLNFDRPGEGLFRPMPDKPAETMKWKLRPYTTGTDDRGRAVDADDKRSGKVDLSGLPVQMDVRLRYRDARAGSGRALEPAAGS